MKKIRDFLNWIYRETNGQFITHILLACLLLFQMVTYDANFEEINKRVLVENNAILKNNEMVMSKFFENSVKRQEQRESRLNIITDKVTKLEKQVEKNEN